MRRKECLICHNDDLEKIIDLGMQPFADTFIKEENLGDSEFTYPLVCTLCSVCGHIQTMYETNPLDRYSSLNDYSYTSSNSNFSRNHWDQFVKEMIELFPDIKKNDSILEIGSNDGYLLKQFINMGYYNVYGVDPSQKMVELAKNIGVETINDLFPFNCQNNLALMLIRGAKLIIANNVFNHSDNPLQFVKQVYNILDNDGVFVFEVPNWYYGFKSFKFDQIYHEHISYFTANSCLNILKKCGMYVYDVEHIDYHGGSIRIYAKKNIGNRFVDNSKILDMIEKEVMVGLYDKEYYKFFMNHIKNQRNRFLKRVLDIKLSGENIVAVGAAAKGNTFLNYYRLDNSLIDYVTDSSLQKQGKYTPLTRIPIVGDDIFAKYSRAYALILSWNISINLKESLLKLNPNIIFISPEDNE